MGHIRWWLLWGGSLQAQATGGARIHNVFHVSQLKKYHGQVEKICNEVPVLWEQAEKEPAKILGRRMVKKGNRAVSQVLVY